MRADVRTIIGKNSTPVREGMTFKGFLVDPNQLKNLINELVVLSHSKAERVVGLMKQNYPGDPGNFFRTACEKTLDQLEKEKP